MLGLTDQLKLSLISFFGDIMSKVKVLIGDMFASSAQTLVNTVNCVGVMGKGIAQEFKKRYPGMYDDYAHRCSLKQVKLGEPYHYIDMLGHSVINFPTKGHWRSPSKYQDIVLGLNNFINSYKGWGIESVAFPPLGCGNGGLEWALVGPTMYQMLKKIDIPVEIYAPFGTPKQQLSEEFLMRNVSELSTEKGKRWTKFNPSWIALLEVLRELSSQPYANPVGRTIFQKICYIMTEQGVNTGFHFKQGSYGPFSDEVKEALSVFANMNLIKEEQLGRMNALMVGNEFDKIVKKHVRDIEPLRKKIYKTVDLFSRIKNTEQAEEVTTVLFSARQLKKEKGNDVSEKELYDYIVGWKKSWARDDKQKSIASAIRNLEMLDWLRLEYSDSLPESSEDWSKEMHS